MGLVFYVYNLNVCYFIFLVLVNCRGLFGLDGVSHAHYQTPSTFVKLFVECQTAWIRSRRRAKRLIYIQVVWLCYYAQTGHLIGKAHTMFSTFRCLLFSLPIYCLVSNVNDVINAPRHFQAFWLSSQYAQFTELRDILHTSTVNKCFVYIGFCSNYHLW